jgi:L-ascorbate metabolism protein UlaG (beta-lactamase superfamily)
MDRATECDGMPVEHGGHTFERPGHASVRIETGAGTVVYVDPWSEVIEGEPNDANIVFVTHDDFDHYDPEGIAAVAKAGATVAAFEGVDADDLDYRTVALAHDGEANVNGIAVRTLPAYNDPEGDHVDDDGEPFHAEGDGVGLLLTVAGTRVLVPSDTDVWPHHEAVSADVLLPPIGGHYTMDRHEAAGLARAVGAELVLPVHYDTFAAIETDAAAFADELDDDGIEVVLF